MGPKNIKESGSTVVYMLTPYGPSYKTYWILQGIKPSKTFGRRNKTLYTMEFLKPSTQTKYNKYSLSLPLIFNSCKQIWNIVDHRHRHPYATVHSLVDTYFTLHVTST